MRRFAPYTINGLSLKNFHVSWKAWKRCARKATSDSFGELRLGGKSKSGRPKLSTRFRIKELHGKAWTEVRTQEQSCSKNLVPIGRWSLQQSSTNQKDL